MQRPNTEPQRAPRVLLYSHDSVGLGHLRRTLNIAEAIADALPGSAMLLASGSVCATHFPTPPGLDVVKLPSIGKDERGAYASRQLPQPLAATIALRRELLLGLVRTFQPDLVVVDQKVLGVADELTPVLELARANGAKTLLGVRDIIDTPEVVANEWGRPNIRAALAGLYDRVLVYGSPEVFDARIEYPFPPELREAIRFTGYVVRPARGPFFRAVPGLRRRVVVTTGGGEDGGERVAQYLGALELAPYGWDTELVLGPMLDPDASLQLTQRARALPGVNVRAFHPDLPRLIADSDLVCAMAGYNTVAETTRSRTRAIYLPRTFPRREQELRAERFEGLGLARCVLSLEPTALRAAVEEGLAAGRVEGPLPPLDGCSRVADEITALLGLERRDVLGSGVAGDGQLHEGPGRRRVAR